MKTKIGALSTLLFLLLVAAGLLLSSCASTRLTSTWTESTYTGGSLKSVLVVAMAKDARNRRVFEDSFAKEFKKHGAEAFSLSATLSKTEGLTADDVLAEAKRLGVQTIFVSRLVSVEDKEVYHPPTTTTVHSPSYPYNNVYGNFQTYYPYAYSTEHTPGYTTTETYINIESNIYTMDGKMIWSVLSETIDPNSVDKAIADLSELIMKNLKKNNLVG
jgi:hypothetical protein